MGVQGALPPAGARGILSGGQVIGAPAFSPFPKRSVDSALDSWQLRIIIGVLRKVERLVEISKLAESITRRSGRSC